MTSFIGTRIVVMSLASTTRSNAPTERATRCRSSGRSTRSSRVVVVRADASSASRMRRRDALLVGLLLATEKSLRNGAFADEENAADEDADVAPPAKTRVVITGSNSGIGLDAAYKLATTGTRVVVLACRTLDKAERAKREILQRAADEEKTIDPNDVECFECDLASLASVRKFARDVGGPVDALALNAGLEYSGDPTVHRTEDGFEETIGVNHLGHFLLANLLLPKLEASSAAHPRIVVTSSEVHDPSSPGGSVGKGATLGDLSGMERDGKAFEMISGEEYDADKAYKDSKLCNMLFAYELERRLEAAGSKITVNSFGPGLITRTGLFRHQPALFVKAFDIATNDIFKVAETVDGGGNCLVYMLTDETLDGVGGTYFNNKLSPGTPPTGHAFVQTPSSAESKRADEAAKLWSLSESLVGLR